MTHCGGCGAHHHSTHGSPESPESLYGHILGCGSKDWAGPQRRVPCTEVEQQRTLERALAAAVKALPANTKPDTPAFATALALTLSAELNTKFKDPH